MVVVGILIFAFLVLIHEYGHFLAARRNGVDVQEFGLGFPPRLLSKKKSKTLYSLNLIPLGGFVRLKGESSSSTGPRTFGGARYTRKAKILLAGVAMNILAAFGLLLILAWSGMPAIVDGQFSIAKDERITKDVVTVASVAEGSPASEIGLVAADSVLTLNGEIIKSTDQLINLTKSHPGQPVVLTWQHGNQIKNQTVELEKSDRGEGRLGIVPFQERVVRYTWAAPLVALGLTLQLVWLTLWGLVQIVVGLVSQGGSSTAVAGAVGPVGVFALLTSAGQFGWAYVVVLMVVISISLAVVNTLPIPALDGGRLALISIYRVLRKPLSDKVESLVHGVGFAALLGLAVLISYFDVVRFF